jgi:hypothetical protein
MNIEKVGRNEWKSLNIGQIGMFTLPNAKAVEVARVAMSQVKRLEGMDFERIETNDPLTIAYKRTK